MHEQLLCHGVRFHRHLTSSDGCPWCGMVELCIHTLRDCRFVRNAWHRLHARTLDEQFVSSNLPNRIAANIRGTNEWADLFSNMIWHIWKLQKDKIFNDRADDIDILISIARATTNATNIRGTNEWADLFSNMISQVSSPSSWSPQPPNWLKLNTHSASKGIPGLASYRGILRTSVAGANKTLRNLFHFRRALSLWLAVGAQQGFGEDATDYKAVFVDTNLDTHLAIPVSFNDTAIDLKRKILAEHSKCFLEFGEIEIRDLKVRCKEKLYTLSDLMPVRSVFAWTKKNWFVFADISSQFGHYEAADHNIKLFADPQIRMLPPASPLQGGHKKDERNLQTDNLSGEARSETLQLVADFNNDDNAKSSSSDTYKRLNAVVESICNFSSEKKKVTVLRSGRNSSGLLTEATSVNRVGKSSDVGSLEKNKTKKKRKITANVHTLNGNDAVEIGSVDKDSASQKLEIMTSLDQNVDDCKHCDHVDTGVGSAGENKQTLALHGEGDKILESHDRDTQDIPIGSDKTKGTTKKKNKRMTKAEMMNDETFSNIDALDNVSTKSHALSVDAVKDKECSSRNIGKNIANGQSEGNDISGAYWSTHIMPDSGTTEKHNLLLPDGGKNMNMHVQCNNNNVGSSINLDKDGTEELVGLESVPDVRDTEKEATTFGVALESGMRRSKKRKNGGDDVSHQVDTKGNGEHGVPDIEDKERQAEVLAELPELGMTRPLKRKKTGFDLPDVIKMDGVCDEKPGRSNSKHHSQTQKSKKKAKQKQTPVIKNIAESMGDQRDTMDTEKSKSTRSKSGDEKDDNIQPLSSAWEQIGIVVPVVTSEADIETTTKICVDEVLITNHEINVKSQGGADATIHNDAEPMQITQVQKSEEVTEIKNKRSSKKTKQKQNVVVNMSEFPVEDQKNNLKLDRSKSACSESAAEKNDEMELSSSFQEKIDKAASVADANADIGSAAEKNDEMELPSSFLEKIDKGALVADANADIEMRNAKVVGVDTVDDKVVLINHESDVVPQKEVDETMQYDAEPMQLTQIQKSEKKNGSKSEKSKKKIKQKQSHPLKSISEFSVEDQINSIKLERSKSTLLRSEAEKADRGSLSSPVEQMDNVSRISAPQADAEVSNKAQVDGVIITNHGSDVSLEQKADDACQDDVEPLQLTQAQRSRLDTEIKSVQTKKKTKQQTRTGKNVPKVVEGEQADARNGISLEKDQKIAPVEGPLNAAIQYAAADPLNSKVESSALKTKDSVSLLNGIASTRLGNRNDSMTSSSHSGVLNKRLHQGKATKELPKIKQSLSSLRNTSNKSTQTAARNPLKKKSLISKSSSIFKDESSSSAETKGGGDASDSSTENPYDDHVSSSEDESRGSWASPNHGNSKNGGVASQSKPTEENLTMESILRSSHKYKKAKLVASRLQLQDDESQPVDVVPDSQVNT